MNRYLATLAFVSIFISANCQITVNTTNATNITAIGATLNGNYNPNGFATQYTFRIWENGNTSTAINYIGNLPASSGVQSITYILTNLKPTTQYTYVLTVNQSGNIYSGNPVIFATPCGAPPSVTTMPATNITSSSARLSGSYITAGGCSITSSSYTVIEPSLGNVVCTVNLSPDITYYNISGLKPSTRYTYKFSAYQGTLYNSGAFVEFTTTCELPSAVTTKQATSIESRSAILQGSYNAGSCLTSYYFLYGTTTNYELSTPIVNSTTTGTQNVSFSVEHLAPNTTYHYRLVVTQQGNPYSENDLTLTTSNDNSTISSYEPDINSFTATNITSTGFKAKWDAVEGAELYYVSWKVDGSTYSTAPQTASTNELDITGLVPNTKYYFRVQTKRNGQLTNWSPSSLKGFKTLPSNQAPSIPNNYLPIFGYHFPNPLQLNLSWVSVDPENDPIVFDLYMGTSQGNLTKICSTPYTTYSYNATNQGNYYWKVIAYDNAGNSTEGPVWYFTVGSYALTNFPPTTPSNPFPENRTFGTAIHPTFSWTSFDPEGQSVACDIFLGTSTDNLVKLATVAGNSPEKSFISVNNLAGQQTYYWKVVSTDNLGATTESPIWSFTTCEQNQVITFNPIPAQTYSQVELLNIASAPSGLSVTYFSSKNDVAKVVDGKIQIVGSGECVIYANQQGKAGYWCPAQQANQTLTVNPMPVEVIAVANQKVYGETDPAFTYQFSPNLLNDDSFTGTLSRASGDNAGTYTIQQGSLSAGNNYSITFHEADFIINKKNLNIKAENKSKSYGETNPELTLLFDGFVNNEDKSVIDNLPTISCSATQNSISGTYSIELAGGADNNYNLALENGTLQVNTILGNVSTSSIQNITNSAVDVYGELTNHGGEETIIRGFVYGTSANPTIQNSKVEVGTGMGPFNQTINSLSPNTKYYIRSYATNSAGTVYGNELSFTTLSTEIPVQEVSSVTFYPNPTSGVLHFKNIDPKAKVEIYNLSGTLVQRLELVNNQVNIKELNAGTYVIKIISNDKVNTIKIIKE